MNTTTASYKELRDFIKAEKANSQAAKDFFGNYTHETTESLKNLVQRYNSLYGTATVKTVVEKDETNVDEIVEILINTVEKLKRLPSYVKKQELKQLHEKAMEIEFELGNS